VFHRLLVAVLRVVWVLLFMAVVFTPLVLSTQAGGRGDLTIELSLTLALLAFSLLVAAIVLPSRVRSISVAFGIERVLRSHRWLAVAVTTLVLIHLALVVADHPASVALLDARTAPPRARAATAATIALIGLCVLSLWRRQLKTPYQWWRRLHVVLAIVALVGSLLHVLWLNHLMKDDAMRAFFSLVSVFLGLLLLNRWVRRPLRALRHAYVIHELRQESPTVSTLALRPAGARQSGLAFRPGQFAWIRLSRPFGLPESHPFTIASGSHDPRLLEFTIKHAGDWTNQMPHLAPGRRVFVDGPHGDFTLDLRPSKRLLFVAAGVGMTPMMSMLRTLADRGDRRPVRLVVGARTQDELLFQNEIYGLREQLRLTVIEVLSSPPPGWQGRTGRVDQAALAAALGGRAGSKGTDVFICGPPAMVEGAVTALEHLGVPQHRVHTEQFDMV